MSATFVSRALASCWRVLVLLLLVFTLFGGWLYWQWPGLNSLRPQIEHYLQQDLQLQTLKLGKLSWSWSGFLWVESSQLQFASRDQSLAFHHGRVAVRIDLTDLLQGDIQPDRIRLVGGRLDVHVFDSSAPVPLTQLILDDVEVGWRYGEWLGTLEHVDLTLDGMRRSIKLASPSLSLSGRLAEDGLLQSLKMQCSHTDWLPQAVRHGLQGRMKASVTLQRSAQRQWGVKVALGAEDAVTIIPVAGYSYRLNRLDSELTISTSESELMQPTRITMKHMNLVLGDNRIAVHGGWQQGMLTLKAESKRLEMPLVWSWLHGLGDEEWQQWLTRMHAGYAHNAYATFSLGWASPLQRWPSAYALERMHYHVQADIEEADIALGQSQGALLHTAGKLVLDEQGLHASIASTQLPEQLGTSSGTLAVSWATLALDVSGKADADMDRLLQWLAVEPLAEWDWHAARADASYHFIWSPGDAGPRQSSAVLHPAGLWNLGWADQNFDVSDGEISWDSVSGLRLNRMHVASSHLQGLLSLKAVPAIAGSGKKSWQLQQLDAQAHGALMPLLTSFQVPVAHVEGTIRTSIHYDGQWSGLLDLKQASWEQLLGSTKRMGEKLSLHYDGDLKRDDGIDTIELTKLKSIGAAFKLRGGSLSLNRNRIKAQLQDVDTPSFRGSLDITLPFNDKPWQADVRAQYLNRNALPESLDQAERLGDKGWMVRATIDRFDWDDATMSGVHLYHSSSRNSVGMFEAAQVHTSQMDIMDVVSRFTLPGDGRVELRKFSASVEKQHLLMSAILTPIDNGGMRWSGFAELEGDFGHLMKRGGFSQRFLAGHGHLLFSGQGMILREQPWWQGLDGRLRLRVDDGRILEGGTLTTLLAAINLSKLPALLFGQRDDLSGPGIKYERLQMEAIMQNQDIHIRNVALRSTAFDLVGHGLLDLDQTTADMYLIARPLQNIDALLGRIPLLRDLIGGSAHSLIRHVYHMSGPFSDAKVERVTPEQAGLASAGLIERMLTLPNEWFGSSSSAVKP
ncbi:MAG: AsmA-like C-terminal domain-containing protein [Mariprofundus sp.]